jgi:hypothetical protein
MPVGPSPEDEDFDDEVSTGAVTDADLENEEDEESEEEVVDEGEDPFHIQYLDEINIITSEGYRDPLSLDTERGARLCLYGGDKCRISYRLNVRAMLTKMPGHFFTGYQSA